MKRLFWVLWPSFIMAGIAEGLFFTIVDPQEFYLFGEPIHLSPITTYSVGFFAFWAVCAGSSLFTCILQNTPDEVNRVKSRGLSGLPYDDESPATDPVAATGNATGNASAPKQD